MRSKNLFPPKKKSKFNPEFSHRFSPKPLFGANTPELDIYTIVLLVICKLINKQTTVNNRITNYQFAISA